MFARRFVARRDGALLHRISAVLVIGLLLAVAACGGTRTGGGATEPTPRPTPTPTATPAPIPSASWRLVSSPSIPQYLDSELHAVSALSSGAVWAVGDSYTDGLAEQSLIERWDGSAWRAIPYPTGLSLANVLAISPNDVWASGFNITPRNEHGGGVLIVVHWNGTAWSTVPSPTPSVNNAFLLGMAAVSSNDVWMVGQTYPTPFVSLPLTERWDGASWKIVANADLPGVTESLLNSVARIPGTNQLWAVGYALKGPRPAYEQPLIERWDGASWQVVSVPTLPSGSFGGVLHDVVALSATDAWAVGNYTASDHTIRALIAHWNGSSWQTVTSPDTWGNLSSVAAAGPHDVRAVGYVSSGDGNTRHTLIEQWDGATWQIVPSGEPSGAAYGVLNSVATDGTSAFWAVGSFHESGGHLQPLIERCP